MKPGFIYILVNPFIPGMVKIGYSTGVPIERAKRISQSTGVPTQFAVVHEVQVGSCEDAEREIHAELDKFRVNSKREFFAVSVKEAIEIVEKVATKFPVLMYTANSQTPEVPSRIKAMLGGVWQRIVEFHEEAQRKPPGSPPFAQN